MITLFANNGEAAMKALLSIKYAHFNHEGL